MDKKGKKSGVTKSVVTLYHALTTHYLCFIYALSTHYPRTIPLPAQEGEKRNIIGKRDIKRPIWQIAEKIGKK